MSVTVRDQAPLVEDVLANAGWLIWLDGARYDYARDLFPEFLDVDPLPAWNGDIGYTGDWAVEHLAGEYPDLGCFSPAQLWGFGAVDYDAREHFGHAPQFDEVAVETKLAALGYLEADSSWSTHSERVADFARAHLDQVAGGVIRFIRPHPPLLGLDEITGGSGKLGRTKDAVERGDLTVDELHAAYEATYRSVLEVVADLVADLDGRIAITADHGECLLDEGCKQVFHRRGYEPHNHLVNVPWAEVR